MYSVISHDISNITGWVILYQIFLNSVHKLLSQIISVQMLCYILSVSEELVDQVLKHFRIEPSVKLFGK